LDDHTSYKNGYTKTKNDSSKSFGYQRKPDNFQSLVSDKARVYKGGSWKDVAYWMSPGTRRFLDEDSSTATIGFRCAMTRVGSPKGNRLPGGNQIKTGKPNTRRNYR
jgi:formylglycine-generating enzyme required for sulfatase activity